MRFQYDGKTYEITFGYEFKQVRNPYWRGVADAMFTEEHPEFIKSKFPYISARLDVVEANNPEHPERFYRVEAQPFRVATVGCLASEKYLANKGRVRDLRLISMTISNEMRNAMWKAYNERNRPAAHRAAAKAA